MLALLPILGSMVVSVCGSTVDTSVFASVAEIREITEHICHGGPRMPGSEQHVKVVDYIEQQLEDLCELEISRSSFELDDWQPADDSLYKAGRLTVDGIDVDIAAAIAYSLPTNGSAISGQLVYLGPNDDIKSIDMKGKIIMRDYSILNIPYSFLQSYTYYASSDATNKSLPYSRPFLDPPHADLLAASLGGAAGYISAFNVSRQQLEGYYSGHSGTHWNVPGVFVGAEQYQTLRDAAARNATAAIQVNAKSGKAQVPRLHATLPGMSEETIVLATHTDGVTYVQENGAAALITLARYFASLPLSQRPKTILFAFEASHLAYQLDSDKSLAKALDATYDNPDDTTAFVIAIEHLGTREIEVRPTANGAGNTLGYTGQGEALLWSVGPVDPAIAGLVDIVKNRNLDSVFVAKGFPPGNPANKVPDYPSFGGLGSYYTNALLPTMALISGPWSLWAPSFDSEAIDYDRLREQHIAIGDAVMMLSQYSKHELAGNYTSFRERRANGTATTVTLNYDHAQWITDPNAVYY